MAKKLLETATEMAKKAATKASKKLTSAKKIIKAATTSAIKEASSISEQTELAEENKKMAALVEKQRAFFFSGKTKDPSFRKEQLQLLHKAISTHEEELFKALRSDLFKSPFESYATEIGMSLEEISYQIKHVKKWSKPKSIKTSLFSFPSTGKIYSEPYGVSLIMSPWNYPFMLTIEPLAGAIASGNCAIIKPSRYSPATSLVLGKIIKETFPEEYICVVQGGHLQNTALLNQHFDFIFFTGSVEVGKIVMESASKFLTPVCLELGGKSPCIVDANTNIELAARRIVWGKFLNAGQTCVAPDYILVNEQVHASFLNAVHAELKLQFGSDPLHNSDFCKIINEKHFQRLTALCPEAQADSVSNKIAPTIVQLGSLGSEAVEKAPLMQEEIFGPIMPIITYKNIDDVISFVNKRNEPLALYLFTNDKSIQKKIISNVRYGGGCINDVIFHVSMSNLPFGGVGESGMGTYHGKNSFNTFYHFKSVLKKSNRFDTNFRYAPYEDKLSLIKRFMH